jgi:hypothetical protein
MRAELRAAGRVASVGVAQCFGQGARGFAPRTVSDREEDGRAPWAPHFPPLAALVALLPLRTQDRASRD